MEALFWWVVVAQMKINPITRRLSKIPGKEPSII